MKSKTEIIPAIDLIDGKCVRLAQGDYDRKVIYNENPLEVAKMFEASGIERLHLVDLDGAKAGHIVNHRILEEITTHTGMIVDFGGGLKTDEDLKIAFASGAKMVTGGSIAVKQKETFLNWLEKYGNERIILGADAKDEKIAVGGWLENTSIQVLDFIAGYHQNGITKVISTDISRDGMLTGPAYDLYEKIMDRCPDIDVIASGGIAVMDDILRLDEMNVAGVITGKAIYENKITLKEIERFIVDL